MLNTPRKITPTPIIEVVLEVIFDSDIPVDAVFGLVYEKLRDKYSAFDKLPILQLPETIRNVDPGLKHQAHYSFNNSQFRLNVGPRVFALIQTTTVNGGYSEWSIFYNEVKDILSKFNLLGLIKNVNRVGLRYINFFEENIFENINISINSHLTPKSTVLVQELEKNGCLSRLQIASNVEVVRLGKPEKGSVIDLDVFKDSLNNVSGTDLNDLIELIHKSAKDIFFGVLKEEFISALNPDYDE